MKTALITGTSRGIGKALAEKFMAEGWFVVGTAVSGLNLPNTDKFAGYDLDLSSHESISAFAEKIISEKIKIDLLINNAGVVEDEFDEAVIVSKLRKTFEVNLFGLIDLTEQLLPSVVSGGQVFNISSTAGMLSKELRKFNYPCYKISKTALNMYTRVLAGNLAEKDIFVASVHPGWVKTDMGGAEADLVPEDAAIYIYDFAKKKKSISDSGLFWFKSEKLPW
ncbi:MAG: SDR family NAD(P)-dependent oxidoreductase [Candidatus Paceibacterota bacterium]|jgi:NAD(P)-dependent dehydrogenase (short-subunit alcohol dehydrogenase family)